MKKALKRSLSLLLAIALIFSSTYVGLSEVDWDGFFAVRAKAASTSDLTFYLNSDGESYSVTDCNSSATGEIVIPATYNGKPVTSIGNSAFSGCTKLESVIISGGVTSIGEEAFECCNSLTTITIPDSVTSIGNGAFNGCSGISSITIPDSVTSIGDNAFYTCPRLTSITVDLDNLNYSSINGVLFNKDKTTLIKYPEGKSNTAYIIPDGVTSIAHRAFRYCESLTSIEIPDSVTSIGDYAFFWCTYLASITIPDSVTSIGDYAFSNCVRLKDVYYSGIEADWAAISIGSGNEALTGATIHCATDPQDFEYTVDNNQVTITDYIGTDTEVIIPRAIDGLPVTRIGNYAFSFCTSLASVKIPDSVTSIGNGAFNGCSGISSITIPDSVTSIGSEAFFTCTSLTSITIPDSVTYIGTAAFAFTSKLSEIKVGASNPNFSSVDGVLLTKDKTTLIAYPIGKEGSKYIIPDSVKTIGNCAFYVSSLEAITIPESVLYIESGSFFGCSNLKTITIPGSVTTIANSAFSGCSTLKDVYYGGTQSDWAKITIGSSNSYLTNAAIHCATDPQFFEYSVNNNEVTITDYTGTATEVIIPRAIDGLPVTRIGKSAFEGNTTITTIHIPDTLKRTENGAFYNCNKLNAVYITDLTAWCSIEHYSSSTNPLYYARNLYINGELATDIVIPEGVTKIEDYAFYWGTSIKSVTIPKTVTAIGYSAFHNCKISNLYIDNLEAWCKVDFSGDAANPMYYTENTYIDGKLATEIVIPDTVTKIKKNSFMGCKTITSLTVPSSVTSILNLAIYNCSRLSSITIPDSVTNINYYAFYNTGYYNKVSNWEDNVLYINNHLIGAKTSLSGDYVVKDGTKTIAYQAFYGCKELTTIVLPDGITGICDWAFYDCTSLTSIAIPESIKTIGYYAFKNCNSLVYVFYSGLETDWAEISISVNDQLEKAAIHYNSTDHTYKEEYIAPTCTEDGGQGEKCTVCGYMLDFETLPATGHIDTEWITEQEPTCTETGHKDEWCLDCGEVVNTEEISALGHSYGDWQIDVKPTCTENGSKHQVCSVCGDAKTELILSVGHNYSIEWIIDIAPTCTVEGSKSHHCTACGDKTDITVVAPLGHIYSNEWTIDVSPTCTEEGSKSRHCTVCDEAEVDVTAIEPLGHDYKVVSVVDEHPHSTAFKCSRCPETKVEESYSDKCGVCNFSYTDNGDGTCKITGYIGSSAAMIIPATIDGKTVSTTNTGAFKSNIALTSVKIENGVQGIGSLAFLGCSSLSEVVIPESVTSIGTKAFYNCASDFTIYCYSGSYAEQYAIDNSLNYVVMDIGETDNSTIDYENEIIFVSIDGLTSLDDIIYVPSTSSMSVQASLVAGNIEFLGTGSIVTVVDNGVTSEYTLVVEGDTNGDSVCDALDAMHVGLASNGHRTLEGAYALAADSNADDIVDANDYQAIVNKAVS